MAEYSKYFYENNKATINNEVKLNDEYTFWKKHCYRRFQLMKDSRQQGGREDNWNKWQRQYEAWRPPREADDWQSNIVPPFTTSVVESALSEMVDQTLQPKVAARRKEYQPHATVLNYVKDYTWEVGYGDIELYKGLKQALVLGSTITQEYYYQDKRKVQLIVKYNPKTGDEIYEEKEIYDYDDCYGETVSLWDVWFDPNARTVNQGPYKAQDAIRRYVMHIDTFRNTYVGSKWDKLGLASKVTPGGNSDYYQFYQPPKGIDTGSYVEVLFHWIRNPDKLIILANDIPFYCGPNPYNHKQLPFAMGYDLLEPFSIYGKGEPQLLESIQDELTTNRRMRIDRTKLDIFKMVLIGGSESFSDQDLIPAPMKAIHVDEVANVKEFSTGDINPSAYREEELLKQDGVRVTGIDDRFQSTSPKAATATEAAILKESTMKRLRTKIWVNARTLLADQIRLRVPNILQYYKAPKVHEIVGNSSLEKMVKIRELAEENRLYKKGNKFYELEYRTIVTKNKQIKKTDRGIDVVDQKGDNFFMVTPDLLPSTATIFHYKMTAEPTFPLSKPLMQQRMNELFQQPLVQWAFESGYYSKEKGVDRIMELNDFDSEDFVAQVTPQEQGAQMMIDPMQLIEKAGQENELMLRGESLIGTPYAMPDHTRIHMEFMKSENFKAAANPDIIANFSRHIMEEFTAQNMRMRQGGGKMAMGQAGGMMGPNGAPMPQGGGESTRTKEMNGIMGGAAKPALLGRAVGPENVPDMTGVMNR